MSADISTIVLVGLMGTGKSTVAWELSRRLKATCLDTDKLVEQRMRKSVREVFSDDGEQVFRDVESDVLRECLQTPAAAVVAAAGGVVLREENRAMLKRASSQGRALVVWLSAPAAVLVERTAHGAHRPLIDEDPAAVLGALEVDRAPLYAEVADMSIDVSHRTPESVATLVIDSLEEARRSLHDRNDADD